ncbi:MAG TPA: zinc ribbon domain-containing protein [Vicinamibacteria bacterium]
MRPRRRERDDDERWSERLFGLPDEATRAGLAARAALLLLLALWTLGFLRHGMDAGHLMRSFLHLVHLPFHEAGHVLLTPFGRFVSVLGGSLFQVAIPLLCSGVFLLKNRDPFAASVTLWWAGQSLMDLAPYVADARALRLPLLGGRTGAEVEGHDWEYLLEALGLTRHDVTLGRLSFVLGALVMLAALAWGGTFVWRLRTRLPAR